MEMAMLRVNSKSKTSAGRGTSIITKTSKTRIGIPAWAELVLMRLRKRPRAAINTG
jgi:hypothetical protein